MQLFGASVADLFKSASTVAEPVQGAMHRARSFNVS